MQKEYRLICMSFDGNFQKERLAFKTIDDVWEYSNDLGSKWFFFPFHFVTSASTKTIIDTPTFLEHFKGLRVKTIQKRFLELSKQPEMQNADAEKFLFAL
jgi:hypothetical protein